MSSLRGGFLRGWFMQQGFLMLDCVQGAVPGWGLGRALSSSRSEADWRLCTAVHGGRGSSAWVEGHASFREEERSQSGEASRRRQPGWRKTRGED